MDRQMLLAFAVASMFIVGGCNRGKESPRTAATNQKAEASGPTAGSGVGSPDWGSAGGGGGGGSPAVAAAPKPSVEYKTKTVYDFQDDVVEGHLIRPSGPGFGPPGSEPPAAAIAPLGMPEPSPPVLETEAIRQQLAAEAERHRALAEIQERASVLGAFGGQGFGDNQRGSNPLRKELESADALQPKPGNPLRETRIGAIPVPSVAPSSPPAYAPVGGGAAPALDAADHVERFARIAPPTAGGAPIRPSESRAAAPAAPTSAAPAVPLPGLSADADAYQVVQVFYGTDRQSAEPPPADLPHIIGCFWPTATVGFMTACLTLVTLGRRSW